MCSRSWKEKTCCKRWQLDLVSQIIQQNYKFPVYKGMVDNHLDIKINSQLNANAIIIKIDLSFLEGPQPSGNNYVNVQQTSP